MRLGWLGAADDTPLAVSGEVKGPGDDARIELGDRRSSIEVQAKHGLTGGAKLDEVVERIRTAAPTFEAMQVVLTLDRTSSRTVWIRFKDDLERLRSGRTDGLGTDAKRIVDAGGDDSVAVLRRLYVVPIDVDHPHDPEGKQAMQLLASVLEDPTRAIAAWGVLANDADDLCARKLRRNRKDLVDLLRAVDIGVKPLAKDERWHRQLDFCRQLLNRRHAAAALTVLSEIETGIVSLNVEPRVLYRLAQQRASAFLQLDRHGEAFASAQRALDIDPKGVHALVTAAFASIRGGDLVAAVAFANRAVAADSESPLAWSAKAYMAVAAGEPLPNPPAGVGESEHYRTALAQLSVDASEWERALSITADLLAAGVRSPDVLWLRATSLLNIDETNSQLAGSDPYSDAERLATDLIDTIADDSHPYTHQGLVLRARARRLLGRHAEAQADVDRAREIAADDPETIGHAAHWKHEAGDDKGALQILQHPIVDRFPMLLAFRAQVRTALKDNIAARNDRDAALRQVADAQNSDEVRFTAADTSIVLKDLEIAERTLAGVTSRGTSDPRYKVLLGRVALAKGETETARAFYEEAATQDLPNRALYFVELGYKLQHAGRSAEAIAAFDVAGEDKIPEGAVRYWAAALFDNNELVRAQGIIDRLAQSGPLPDWALGLATEIALRRDDVDAAVRHLTRLVQYGQPTVGARIELARRLIELGRASDALPHLEALAGKPDLSPVQRMQTAQLLQAAGRPADALPLGFRAFRDAPGDPQLHRAFIVLSLMSKGPLPTVSEIGPDTHVRLRNQDGTAREHTIYPDQPINPLQGEMNVAAAETAGLLGRKVGDVVVHHEGTWQEQRWTVEAILPAVQYAVQDAMLHYEDRFPGEPFFMAGFHIGDGTSVKDFAPIIASLQAKKELAEEVFTRYRERTLPLGTITSMLGGTIPDAMAQASMDPAKSGPLLVEWSNREGQEESRAAGVEATEVVLTRSALHTASSLGLLGRLRDAYTLVAPRSLYDELRQEVAEAGKLVVEGFKAVTSGPTGLTVQELEPGHPQLTSQLERLRAQLRWLEESARLEARPLETIERAESQQEEARELIGHSSYDAVTLTQQRNATMYADDLGLRRFLPKGSSARSFSSVGLLFALAERGTLTAEERDGQLLVLVQAHYAFVPPTLEVLELVVRRSSDLPHSVVAEVFALLGGPSTTLAEVAQIAAQLIRSAITRPIQLLAPEVVAKLSLQAMAGRWPRPLCALALQNAAQDELRFLPQELHVVQRICSAFRTSGLAITAQRSS